MTNWNRHKWNDLYVSIVTLIIFLTPVKLQSIRIHLNEILVRIVGSRQVQIVLDAFIEETAASWICSLVFSTTQGGWRQLRRLLAER